MIHTQILLSQEIKKLFESHAMIEVCIHTWFSKKNTKKTKQCGTINFIGFFSSVKVCHKNYRNHEIDS